MTSTLLALARFSSKLELPALPPDVLAQAKACLLYALAVGIAASKLSFSMRRGYAGPL